jgi:hypothetical protein
MEIYSTLQNIANSDAFVGGGIPWMMVETYGAIKNINKDPLRLFLNPVSSTMLWAATSALTQYAHVEFTDTVSNAAIIAGYCIPSVIRLLKENKDWTEYSPLVGLALGAGIEAANLATNTSLGLADITKWESVQTTINFISSTIDKISCFKLPSNNLKPLLNK